MQHQQFLIDEPPPRRCGLFLGGRAVDGAHRLGFGEQTVFLQHLRGQRVGQQLRVGQKLPDAAGDDADGQSLGLGVNGFKGRGLYLLGGAHLRVDHLAAQHPAGNDALKIVFLPQLQFLGGVGVIEPCDLQTGYIVPGGDALHAPPTRQNAPAGLCKHLGLYHTFSVGGGFCDGVGLGKVDVPPGVVAQQVCQRHDAQFFKPLCGLGADPFQVAHRGVRGQGSAVFGGHGVSAPF